MGFVNDSEIPLTFEFTSFHHSFPPYSGVANGTSRICYIF